MNKPRIVTVVVTFNRLLLLQQCITALKNQTWLADEIVIINNGSTDDTGEWLSTQSGITIITQANAGSSGGQYTGIKYAADNNFDWIWCMDDDTIATPDALKNLVTSDYFLPTTSFLSSAVLWKDNTFHKMNQPLLKAGYYENEYSDTLLSSEVVYASFVSLLINSKAVTAVGYPLKKMFIWYDDLEYTIRLTNYGPGFFIHDSIVYHQTEKNIGPDFLPKTRRLNDKEKLGIRNYIFIRKKIYPFHKKKTKHIYIYIKSVAAILKYGFATNQASTTIKAIAQGIVMNSKE